MSTTYHNYFVTVGKQRYGFEYSRVFIAGKPYLDRYIAYLGGPTLRLHKFSRGDDARAPHDHPWWFITLPLKSYWEKVYRPYQKDIVTWRRVQAFRFHFRPAKYRHIVIGAAKRWPPNGRYGITGKPFWTFVITGSPTNKWGFWPEPGRFVSWREWV